MGRSNTTLEPFYNQRITQTGDVALLGFVDNNWFSGDLYDRSLDNWDINSPWKLPKKYDTIICTRCAYFAKYPEDFILRCHNALNENGRLYVDWGLGDHWRFENYKIGWIKDNEQERHYGDKNYLWSTVWDDSFEDDENFKLFSERVKKFGYDDVKQAIFNEVPSILDLSFVKKYFDVCYHMVTLWEDKPQLYIFLDLQKIL